MKTVLVTGSAGFIGSSVSEALLRRGYRVVGLDNFDPYYPRAVKEENLLDLRDDHWYSFIEGDVRDELLLSEIMRDYEPWGVVHLAALAGVRPSLAQPDRYMDVNVTGATRVLEACRLGNVQRVAFASSSSVYGGTNTMPFSEDQPTTTPLSPYAASKIAGEACCHTHHHLYGLGIICLRYFTVYGPRQRQDLAISTFTRQILGGEPIKLFGDGSSSRDYTYIDDIVEGTIAALESPLDWDVVNLGGSRPVTLTELVEQLQEALGEEAIIERLPMQPGDMLRTCADVSHARKSLGWEARVKLDEGLHRYAAWYRSRQEAPVAAFA
ncbi:MAG: NAD-dependent epimerase/dehydratase family protein [Armatimonadota bacterium]